jgi:hypothetical protein
MQVGVPVSGRAAVLPRISTGVSLGSCVVKLLLHAFTSLRHYGYFRDELYYLDMRLHLAWDYVDAAPIASSLRGDTLAISIVINITLKFVADPS